MSGSSHASHLVAAPVTVTALKSCLTRLGWSIALAGEQAINATLNLSTNLSSNERHTFSAVVTWQAQANNVLVSIKVLETAAKQADAACAKQAQRLLEEIRHACGEAEQPRQNTAKRWIGPA